MLDLKLINIQYNAFDTPYESHQTEKHDASSTRTLRISIDGMTCAACVQIIESVLLKLDGTKRVSVSLPFSRATVVFDSDLLPPSKLEDVIRDAGYGAKVGDRNAEESQELLSHSKRLASLRNAFSSAAALSSILVAIEAAPISLLPFWLGPYCEFVVFNTRLVVAIWVILYDSRWIHRGAWARERLTLGMDTLVSLSLLLGLALSLFNISMQGWREAEMYFSSGCFLATVITAGRYLDLILRRKSTSNFSSLYLLQSQTVMVYARKDQVCSRGLQSLDRLR